jgi:GTP pyrophosphokinase
VDRVLELYNHLIKRIEEQKGNTSLVSKAFDFSFKCHLGQFRLSGEPYIIHPLEVAHILCDYYMDEITMIMEKK